jgi:hypothetical protein
MFTSGALSLRRSPSTSFFECKNRCQYSYMKPTGRQVNMPCISMGPVIASLVLYMTKHICTQILSRQLYRKGGARKIRRLASLMKEHTVLTEFFWDFIEEILNYLMVSV